MNDKPRQALEEQVASRLVGGGETCRVVGFGFHEIGERMLHWRHGDEGDVLVHLAQLRR